MFIPKISGKRELRDAVVIVLSSEWPLSAKQVFHKARADFPAVSYQGVHKALRKLTVDGVVKKAGNTYSLDEQWVRGLKEFGEKLEQVQSGKGEFLMEELKRRGVISVSFDTAIDFAKFIASTTAPLYKVEGGKGIAVAQWRHTWNPLTVINGDYLSLREIFKNAKCYALVRGNTLMDRFLGNLYTKFGAEFRFGVDCAVDCDLLVINDYVMYVYFSLPVKRAFELSSKKMKSPGDFNSRDYFDWVHKPGMKIHVIMVKDKEAADQIIGETLKYFKK